VRTSLILLALAAAVPAAELTLEELSRQSYVESGAFSIDQPFRLRAGVQSIATGTTIDLNSSKFDIGDDATVRSHVEGLVLIQPLRNRPGLILGAGASRTVVNITDTLGQSATILDALGGLTLGLSADNQWRIDLLGYAGFGWGKLGDDFGGKATEYGVELALNGPLLRRWNLEWSLSVGWSRLVFDPGSFDIIHASTVYPVNLELNASGPSLGIAILWRP